MTPERWEKVGELFQAALALPPEGRETFLNEACDDDAAMRSEVESLLAAADGAGSFLAAGAMNDAAKMIVDEDSLKLVGKRLGHYQVLSQLGSGGMGQVYLAEDTNLKRQVALKLLPAELTANQDRLQRFKREARAASALNHPNIITIHEIGQVDGLNFIVTEFIQGPTLRQQMATARMDLPSGLEVAVQVASALVAAHAAGIIHRDLKPENIMLRPDGLVKVLDFGLAKLKVRADPRQARGPEATTKFLVHTEPGLVMGTAAYMSPEQARGKEVDARTDIFSLGAVIYEMLSGRAPFAGETAADIIGALLHREPEPVSNAPVELQHIVNRALRKDSDERYQTVKSLFVDLKTLKQELEFAAKLERRISPDNDAPTKNRATAKTALESGVTHAATARPTARAEYIVGNIKRRRGIFLAGLAILLLAAIGLGYRLYTRRTSNAAPIESIAVMPFVNDSGDSDVEYLSEGMTESLINSLQQLPQLSVKPSSSVFSYKGKKVEPQQIAKELSVQAILNGRLAQQGSDIVLSLSLVDAHTGNQLWDRQYRRKQTEIIALQNEIARDVSEKLHVRLTPTEQQRVNKRGTENNRAYTLYLQGRYFWNNWSGGLDYEKSVDYFRQAIEIDPNFAPPYAGLADYYGFSMANGLAPDENWPKCEEAVNKALELDDKLAEAYNPQAAVKLYYHRDWTAAESAFRRGIDLNPNFAEIHHHYAIILVRLGREEEGFAQLQRAIDLEPRTPRFTGTLGRLLLFKHQYDRAIDQLNQSIEMAPNSVSAMFAHDWLGYAYEQKRMHREAIEEWSKALTLRGEGEQASMLKAAYAASGFDSAVRSLWQKELDQLKEKANRGIYVAPEKYAIAYARIGDKEQALVWVGRALQERNGFWGYAKDNPMFDSLRDDSRYQLLLRSVVFK